VGDFQAARFLRAWEKKAIEPEIDSRGRLSYYAASIVRSHWILTTSPARMEVEAEMAPGEILLVRNTPVHGNQYVKARSFGCIHFPGDR
jgi:hypothetical protein